MAFPTPAQGLPDGQGLVRNPAYFTFKSVRYGVNLVPFMYGFDPTGAGTYSDNSIGQFVGYTFYGDNAADLPGADAAAKVMSLKEGIRNGILGKVKITYLLPIPAGSPQNSRPRRQQAMIYVPLDKLEEAVQGLAAKEFYSGFKIVRTEVAT